MTNAELAKKHRDAATLYREQVTKYQGAGLSRSNREILDLADRFDNEAARLEALPPDEVGVAEVVPSRRTV